MIYLKRTRKIYVKNESLVFLDIVLEGWRLQVYRYWIINKENNRIIDKGNIKKKSNMDKHGDNMEWEV